MAAYPDRMDVILIAAAVLLFLTVGIVVFVMPIVGRPRSPEPHDDQLRAGESAGTDGGTATDRATGTTAWMRPGGGGV